MQALGPSSSCSFTPHATTLVTTLLPTVRLAVLPCPFTPASTNFATAYLVELFPYLQRSRGITWFQLFGRGATFFATYVNPIGLSNIEWRWLIVYCAWLGFELVFIFFLFPETYGRTLEELSFCKFPSFALIIILAAVANCIVISVRGRQSSPGCRCCAETACRRWFQGRHFACRDYRREKELCVRHSAGGPKHWVFASAIHFFYDFLYFC